MPVLTKPRHEQFAQAVAAGKTNGEAYTAVYGATKGADQSGYRLLRNVQISARISELKAQVASNLLQSATLDRQNRLKALETRHQLLLRVIAERAEQYGKLEYAGPGASTGTLCLDWRGKDAVQPVWKVDTGLLAELRAIEQQIARELGEWDAEPAVGGAAGGTAVVVNVNFVGSEV